MNRVLKCGIAIMAALLCQGCVMIFPSKPHSSATGKIQGIVVDAKGRPVVGVDVEAIYIRGWTTYYPPVPNWFVAGSAVTDSRGRFLIMSKKRVDALRASSSHRRGKMANVLQDGNCIVLKPWIIPASSH